MPDDTPDLTEAVIEFLESIPATISGDTLLFVIVYGINEDPGSEIDNFLPILRDKLRVRSGLSRMSVLIRVIAALDHVLWQSVASLASAKAVMQSAPGLRQEIVDRFLAGHPMRQRHAEQTLANWTRLRDNLLTRQNLGDYERSLLRPPRVAR